MTPLAKRLVIVIVAAAVIAPTTYYIIAQNNYISSQQDPFTFVPSDSNGVLKANFNGTSLYVFEDNGSLGIILPVTVETFNLGINLTAGNTSSPLNIAPFALFSGHQIYKIDNVSLAQISSVGKYIDSSLFSLFSSVPLNLSGTFFAADSGTSKMVIGNLSAVQSSISTSITGDTFSSNAKKYLDTSSNYTFYIAPSNISTVSYITGNISDGHSSIYVALKGNNSLGSFYTVRNGTYNISVSSKEHSLQVGIQGNYTVNQLIGYVSSYLLKAGL